MKLITLTDSEYLILRELLKEMEKEIEKAESDREEFRVTPTELIYFRSIRKKVEAARCPTR
jgi:hypothetical protein